MTERVAGADEEAHLKLKVDQLARTEHGWLVVRGARLAMRAMERRARHHYAG